MKALVTGATGFVGTHLVDALVARGDAISALVRSPAKAAELAAKGVTVVSGDLSDSAALERACQGQDVVYHVGGLTAARSEAEFLAVNRDGTARLAAAAVAVGTRRFVLVSSLSAGGPTSAGRPLSGSELPRPTTQYGRSKLAGEEELRRTPLEWTIVRPPAVYGPGDREMLRVFKAAGLGIAPVFGDGSQELSLVYGPDLAAALVAAANTRAAIGQIFYAAHPQVLTSRAVVTTIGTAQGKRVRIVPLPAIAGRGFLWCTETVARLGGRATLLSRDKANEFFQPAWTCDPTTLTEATGWRAAHDLASGAALTADWYRSRGWL